MTHPENLPCENTKTRTHPENHLIPVKNDTLVVLDPQSDVEKGVGAVFSHLNSRFHRVELQKLK